MVALAGDGERIRYVVTSVRVIRITRAVTFSTFTCLKLNQINAALGGASFWSGFCMVLPPFWFLFAGQTRTNFGSHLSVVVLSDTANSLRNRLAKHNQSLFLAVFWQPAISFL